MPDITQPSNIPVARRDAVRVACEGPAFDLLREDYPHLNSEGVPDVPLTDAQVADVFEATTRFLWRRLMADGRRQQEVLAMNAQIETDYQGDPFS